MTNGFKCNCPQCQAKYDLCPAARELEEIITELTGERDALIHGATLLERTCTELQAERDEAERRLADAVALADVASRDVLAARAERDDARAQAQTHLDGWTAAVAWIDRLRSLLVDIRQWRKQKDLSVRIDAALEGRDE